METENACLCHSFVCKICICVFVLYLCNRELYLCNWKLFLCNCELYLCSRSGVGYHSAWRQRTCAFVSNFSSAANLLFAKFARTVFWGQILVYLCCICLVVNCICMIENCICFIMNLNLCFCTPVPYISSCAGTLLCAKFVPDLADKG